MPDLVDFTQNDEHAIQSAHYFDALPDKVQRVWVEEFKEPKDGRVFFVCSWWETEGGVFSDGEGLCFQCKPSSFPIMPDLITCSRVMYDFEEDTGDAEMMENSVITDNREESWVEEASEAIIALAKTPGLALEKDDDNNTISAS
jgi:hypothetical protein